MNEAQFRISWDSYLGHVSKGFSNLQQNAEFVDMTLAADGHLVKVHQNIVALASPYLKAMLQSASCRHPVIFLNNVSHEILGYILEYIYTGEVKVPIMIINKFVKACKSLSINGIDTIAASKNTSAKPPEPPVERVEKPPDNNFAAHITINSQDHNYSVELIPDSHNTNIINKNEEILPQASAPTVPINTGNIDLTTENSRIINDETTGGKDIDINSINDFVILKPKNNSYANMELDQNTTGNQVTILSDITVNSNDWQTKSCNSYMQLDTNVIENPVNVSLNTNPSEKPVDIIIHKDQWQSRPSQNSSNMELNATINENSLQREDWQTEPIEISSNTVLSTNLIAKPVKMTVRTDDWLVNPIQSTSRTDTNTKPIEKPTNFLLTTEDRQTSLNAVNITLNKNKVYKNLKKIGSHLKAMKQAERTVKILNNVARSKMGVMDESPHYTISNRGSLQLLLNRYLYHAHHNSSGGRKKRWRCIDYRKSHCKAYIDTDNEVITAISETHDHPNHDNQIRKKIKSNIVFTSFSSAVETIATLIHDKDSKEDEDTDKLDL